MAPPTSQPCIGVLLPMDSTFTRLAIRGLKRAARSHDLKLVIYGCLSSESFNLLGDEIPLAGIGYDHTRLDGTISIFGGPRLIEKLTAQHREGHPTTLVLRTARDVPHVLPDDEPAIEALVARLCRHGHRRIAHLQGQHDNLSAQRRHRGYQRGLANASIPYDPALVFQTGFDPERSFKAVTECFDRNLGITAIVAANDAAAFGALRAAKARGIAVPEQLEIIGYDNHFCSALAEPPLSTFEIPLEEMACAAIHETAEQIHRRTPRLESLLAPVFVARSSTRFTDNDPFFDSRVRSLAPEGPLPGPIPRLIAAIPSDSPIESVLNAAEPVMREGIRLDADLPTLVQAIVEQTCRSQASDDLSAERRRKILSAALDITVNATRLTQVQASEHAETFNKITQRLRDDLVDHHIVSAVVREVLGVSGFHEARLYLRNFSDGTDLPSAAGTPGTIQHWDLLTNEAQTVATDDSQILQAAMPLVDRHSMALVLPLIINNQVHGHIITDGHHRFRPELTRLVREVSGALHNIALHRELTRSNATLRESEYFYASLVESLPQVIVRKDATGRITYANSGFASVVGLPLDQILGRTDAEIVPTEFARKLRSDDLRVLTTGEPLDDERTYLIDNQPKIFRVHKSPLRGLDGTITGVQVIFWDVTSFRETEMRLRETQRELIEVSRRAGIAEIATGVLHNIGNALNSVNTSAGVISEKINRMKVGSVGRLEELLVGETEAWRRHFLDEDRGRKVVDFVRSLDSHLQQSRSDVLGEVHALREGVEHVNQIVAAQQQFAQVSGVVDEFDPSEAADYALRLCETELLRHGIVVTRDYRPAPRVRLERHKAVQVLVNLIRNAKDALATSGQATKTLHVGARTTPTGQAQLFVKDNGIGIAAESLPRVFAMGFTTKKGGHGFGLHNSALTATSLGGSLHVESEGAGQGACFLFNLPPCSPEE